MAKRASFAAASFANLRAATGEGTGEPLRIPLADIDEDPNQPRQAFDPADLEGMAATIRDRGVLQPIGVRPAEDGRYMLVFGARRLRASKLAEQSDIPAVVVPEGQRDYATQVIENQQRASLSNSELAAAVNQLHAEGKQGKEIAAICNLKDYQIAAYRAVPKLPPFLAARIDNADIRAVYDLSRAWKEHPAEIEGSLEEVDAYLTITEARRIIAAVTGKASGSVVLQRERQIDETPSQEPSPAIPSASETAGVPPADPPSPVADHQPEKAPPPKSRPRAEPTFTMETASGVRGVLVLTERPKARNHVFLDVGGERQELPFAELRGVSAR